MSDLFGNLPGFAGAPLSTASPALTVPTPSPAAIPAVEEYEDYEVTGSILAPSNFTTAQPGQPITLWGDPERAAALWGRITATDAVLGADDTEIATTTTESGPNQ